MALPTRVSRGADPFDSVQQNMDLLMNRLFGGMSREAANGSNWAPYGVDVREDGDHLYVEAELPGFKKEEIDITLENQTLTISAERREDQKQNGNTGDYLLRERRFTRFARSFTLPPTVDDQSVEAKLVDGILKITLNKREETKPRKVKVG